MECNQSKSNKADVNKNKPVCSVSQEYLHPEIFPLKSVPRPPYVLFHITCRVFRFLLCFAVLLDHVGSREISGLDDEILDWWRDRIPVYTVCCDQNCSVPHFLSSGVAMSVKSSESLCYLSLL